MIGVAIELSMFDPSLGCYLGAMDLPAIADIVRETIRISRSGAPANPDEIAKVRSRLFTVPVCRLLTSFRLLYFQRFWQQLSRGEKVRWQ